MNRLTATFEKLYIYRYRYRYEDYIIVLVGDTTALIFNRDSWICGIYTCKMTAIHLS